MRFNVTVRKRPDRTNLQLAWTDPLTGTIKTKSAGTTNPKKAERAAAAWEMELNQHNGISDISWQVFRDRFEVEQLDGLAKNTIIAYRNALDHFENRIGKVQRLDLINGSVISHFISSMRSDKLAPATIAKNLRHIRGALNWAVDIGLLASAPKFRIPKTGNRKLSRGRPITDDEFKIMLSKVAEVVGDEYETIWKNFIKGLLYSGLRISEALNLSWDSPPVQVDLDSGRRPKIRWFIEGQKNRSDDLTPITPDFYRLLNGQSEQKGVVFPLKLAGQMLNRESFSLSTAKKIVDKIGKKSEVMVNDSKYVTAHDLRRTFATKWALKVHPIVLKSMMRHKTMSTTMQYYVDIDADDVADELWKL